VTALEVATALGARGVRLFEQDGSLAFAPRSKVSQADREALIAHKPALLTLVRARVTQAARVNVWSLDRILEVAVAWSDVRLLIAPGCRVARALRAADPKPGRVWCVCEVVDLLLSGVRPEDARTIAEARLTFDAGPAGITKEGGQ
jgi:hypothetical protein